MRKNLISYCFFQFLLLSTSIAANENVQGLGREIMSNLSVYKNRKNVKYIIYCFQLIGQRG